MNEMIILSDKKGPNRLKGFFASLGTFLSYLVLIQLPILEIYHWVKRMQGKILHDQNPVMQELVHESLDFRRKTISS